MFHTKDIEAAIEKEKTLNKIFSVNTYTRKSVGIDPGFGSSNFGVFITALIEGAVNVLHAEEYPRPDFNEMIKTTVSLLGKHDIRFNNSCQVFVDGPNPSFMRTLKEMVDEDENYEQQIQFYKKHYLSIHDLQFLQQNMLVIQYRSTRNINACWHIPKN